MINEKNLVEKIKSIRLYFRGPRSGEKMVDEYLKHYRQAILDTIEKQPKVNEWIPVEERLPEVNWFYTVCFDDGFITTVEFDGDWILWADATEVVAWMPLPEPYRKEDSDERYIETVN